MLALSLAIAFGQPAARPNVVLIVADDLGYGSLSVYGEKEIPTPNIDSIAKDGVRMTSGYVTCPVCAPTRAGLLSGRYQQRFGFEFNPGGEQNAASNYGLPKDEKTLAEVLKANGYRTGMVGKWHLGYKDGLQPPQRGFDSFFGFLSGAHAYVPGRRSAGILRGTEEVTEREYLTDAFAREAAAFLSEKSDKPFFLYLPFNAVHSPMQAPPRYTKGFDKLTGDRLTYAGMQTGLDLAVGKVLTTLKEQGLDENTAIFFIADNGGPTRETTSSNGPLRGFKGQVYEGGIRVPFMARWKGHFQSGAVVSDPCVSLDLFPTVLELAGIQQKDAKKGLDGRSLVHLLQSGKGGAVRPICWRFGDQHAIRYGDWKLVVRGTESGLFNLREDIAESTDLSAKQPAKRKELEKLYDEWNAKNQAPLWRRNGGDND